MLSVVYVKLKKEDGIKNGNHSAAQNCCHFAATAFPARPD
jgi:hypothetical protein